MQQTSWHSRPVLPTITLLGYLLLLFLSATIVSCSNGDTYGYRVGRHRRAPYGHGNFDRPQTNNDSMASSEAKVGRIFIVGAGLVLFNDTSQPTFKVQRSPDGKLNVVFNDFLIFQTSTSAAGTNYNRNRPPSSNNDAIIFPNDEYICPERREGKSFCTDVPNYLELTRLDKVAPEKFDQFRPYFRDDLMLPEEVTQRMNSEPEEEYYCSSKSQVIYPKSAETKDSKWQLVVQSDTHKQGVLVEQCLKEDKPCKFEESLPRFYTSRCKQNYIFRTMVVLVNREMKEEQVKLPNCCKCVLRSTGVP